MRMRRQGSGRPQRRHVTSVRAPAQHARRLLGPRIQPRTQSLILRPQAGQQLRLGRPAVGVVVATRVGAALVVRAGVEPEAVQASLGVREVEGVDRTRVRRMVVVVVDRVGEQPQHSGGEAGGLFDAGQVGGRDLGCPGHRRIKVAVHTGQRPTMLAVQLPAHRAEPTGLGGDVPGGIADQGTRRRVVRERSAATHVVPPHPTPPCYLSKH